MASTANGDGSITFYFGYSTDSESGVSHYKIYRKKDSVYEGSIGNVIHVGNESHAYVDTTTQHNSIYNYAVSAVDKRGNESALSAWSSNVTAQNTTPPGDVDHDSLAVLAYPDYLQVSWGKVIGSKTSDVATSYVLERQVNSGSWDTIEVNTNTYNWLFNRTTDGYPEIDNAPEGELLLSVFKFRVKAKNIYGTVSTGYDSQTNGVAPTSTTNYGSWVPQTPAVYERTGNRTASVTWSEKIGTSSRKLNGFLRYDVQISKDNTNWYSPTTSLDPYASVDNWKTGSLNGYYSVPVESFTQSLPLETDVANETVKDTTYYYRVRTVVQKASATYSSWQSVTVVAKATSALDVVTNAIKTSAIVDDAITAQKINVASLAAINANLGVVNDGALTIAGNSYNYWVLTDGVVSGKTAGDFRIGNATNYLQFVASTGVMSLSIQYFKIATLETSVLGVLKVSSAGTIDSLTKPFSIENAGAGTTLLKVNGTTAVSLYDTGNVGFSGGITCNGKISTTLTTEQLRLGYDANNYTTYTIDSAGILTISATGTNPKIVINPYGGNVGIGESSPASTCVIRKDSAGGRGAELSIVNYSVATVGSESALNFGLEASSYNADNGNAQIKALLTNVNGATDLITSILSGSSFVERMRIKNDGNVYFGNTLFANNSAAAGATATPAYLHLGNSHSNGSTRDKCKIYLHSDGTGQYGFGVGSWGDIQHHSNFYHDFYIANSKIVSISSAGMGIGVAPDSSYSLKTAGAIYASGLISIYTAGNNYNEGIRIHPSSVNSYSSITLNAVSGDSGTGAGQWSVYASPGTSNNFCIDTNGTIVFKIGSSGTVGIGVAPDSSCSLKTIGHINVGGAIYTLATSTSSTSYSDWFTISGYEVWLVSAIGVTSGGGGAISSALYTRIGTTAYGTWMSTDPGGDRMFDTSGTTLRVKSLNASYVAYFTAIRLG